MSGRPDILRTVKDLRGWTAARKQKGSVAFVPTMGALHEGHIELVRQGLKKCDTAIVSIFVNPTQFGPTEDFSAYPRTWDSDLEKLAAAGAHGVFYPSAAEMYPEDFVTTVSVKGVSGPLEGEHRPGHFDGVATVVAKLLLQVGPDAALFGEKDWQQLQVIRRMVVDLNIPVEIEGVPTVRDQNGLALSSRNAYLSPQQYQVAGRLNKILFETARRVKTGVSPAQAEELARQEIQQAGFNAIDYIAVRDAATLGPPGSQPLRVLAAVRLGKTRLIDNVGV